MAKQPDGQLVPVVGFNYDLLESKVAEKLRSSAQMIRQQLQNMLESAVKIGQELLAVKEALVHRQFLPWLKAEFGWSERTAYNFMSVAQRFELATIAKLPFQPTAAYLLAAPSVTDEARQVAVEKAEAGEEITTKVGKRSEAQARKKRRRGGRRECRPTGSDCGW
jgi:hypothetical protein